MGENKPQVATWVLCVDIDPDNNPESDPMFVAALDMPLDGGLIGGASLKAPDFAVIVNAATKG